MTFFFISVIIRPTRNWMIVLEREREREREEGEAESRVARGSWLFMCHAGCCAKRVVQYVQQLQVLNIILL